MDIRKDKVVTINYNLRDEAGKLIDTSEGGEPLVYLHGNENIIRGLEKHLEGKNPGDSVSCTVPASEAYGERDETLVLKVSRSDFGSGVEVAPGMQFEAHGEEGAQIVTVVGIDGDEVTIDANHPLAGENLHFDVKIVDVRDASEDELSRGHVHSGCECGCDCECDDEDSCSDGCCSCGDGEA